jgi:t-SNARE complex subunit (syntaxin)
MYTAYSSTWTGEEDRRIIKRDVRQVLGNITEVDKQQTELLKELQEQEQSRADRSLNSSGRLDNITKEISETQRTIEQERRNQTERLLPIFFRSFNQTEQMLNATQEMLEFIKFISESFDEEYLIDEVRQYGQSNSTYGNLTIIRDQLAQIITVLDSNNTG